MSEKTLTRMDLSESVFREVGLSRNESAQLVESVLLHMSDALASGESVKISAPVAVTPIECSNCADKERSRVTVVQPSFSIFTSALPALIMGSIVKIIPGASLRPCPGIP